MSAPDPKDLKKLAAACRAAGIKHYRCGDLEFTLSDETPPPTPYKKRKAAKVDSEASNSPVEEKLETDGWDTLSEEQKLFYSSTTPPFEGSDKEGGH